MKLCCAAILKNQKLSLEPRPKGRGMIWEELRTPPKIGTKLPGPEGPGFLLPDKSVVLVWCKNVEPKCARFYSSR